MLVVITIISVATAAVLASILRDRRMDKIRLSGEVKALKECNRKLLNRIPVTNVSDTKDPLTLERIADAIRMEGFYPEKVDKVVYFKIQGKVYFVDAGRLPLLFVVRRYAVDPGRLDPDIFTAAAHRMSDRLSMVKAYASDDGTDLRYVVAARDRNYESFRLNLTAYLKSLDDGQSVLTEAYDRMLEEKRRAAFEPLPSKPKAKVLS